MDRERITADEDHGPEPDPVEIELVAYLDGELEPAASRQLEKRLAADPALRARADALKRSFDLLEFLPKNEPSAAFTSRTLDRLPVASSHSGSKPVVAATLPLTESPSERDRSSPAAQALPLNGSTAGRHPPRPRWLWASTLFFLIVSTLASSYLIASAIRSYFRGSPTQLDAAADNLPISEIRLLQNLPLYAGVDDFDFLQKLAAPEYLGDEPFVRELLPPPTPIEPEKHSDASMGELFQTFRRMSAERQAAIRQLDQSLFEQEPALRERLLRVLENYSTWLYLLPETERKMVFAAPSVEKRIETIHELRRTQWVANLPAAYRHKLKDLPATERAELIHKWKTEEERRREQWGTAKMHLEALRTGRQPWPFTDEKMRKDVLAFVTATYHPNDPQRSRPIPTGASSGDATKLAEALERAEKGEWVWLGKTLYDFSTRYEMFPEPANGKLILSVADLSAWPVVHKQALRPNVARKLEPTIGRWPEFPLAVLADIKTAKLGISSPIHRLGPSRPEELKDVVRQFIAHDLQKKLSAAEWFTLKQHEGKWPDYPRELIRLAKAHDLSVPGAMLPGPPSLWEKTYNPAHAIRLRMGN